MTLIEFTQLLISAGLIEPSQGTAILPLAEAFQRLADTQRDANRATDLIDSILTNPAL